MPLKIGMLRYFLIACFMFFFCVIGDGRVFAEPFQLKISADYPVYGAEPVDRVFKVRARFPLIFYVTAINVSSSGQFFYLQVASSGYSSISFEVTDEEGNLNIIRRKRDPNASSMIGSAYLLPGEKRVFDISMNENDWEGVFKLYREGARRMKVRAIYDNEPRKIYSEYYELIFIDIFGQQEKKPAANSNDGISPILMSK